MPANKYALIRYRVIDECLRSRGRPYPSKEELRAACEEAIYGENSGRVSMSTIEKDIYAMRFDTVLGYEAPIAYNHHHGGYHYTDPEYSIKSIPLGEEDVQALHFAAQTFWQFKELPVFNAFGRVLDKLREHIAMGGAEWKAEAPGVMLFEDSLRGEGERHMPDFLKAIEEHRRIQLSYMPFTEGRPKKDYLLEPYLLKEFRLRWYLLAHDVNAGRVKTFGLDRVEEVALTEEHFLPPSEAMRHYFDHTYGISHTAGKPERIVLEVDRQQSHYLLSRPLHASQKVIDESKETVTLELELLVNQDLVNELLSWSPHVRVLKPTKLRKMLTERLEKMLEKQG